MNAETIENLIRSEFPAAAIQIENLRSDGESRFSVRVFCPSFKGKSRLQQHREVYAALKGASEQDFQSLSLKTGSGG